MKASDSCIALIQKFEGYASKPYICAGGKNTIGYGHVIQKGERYAEVSKSAAVELLCKDLERFEACVEALVDLPLAQFQFDALCSFAFNLGCENLKKSTLLRKLNEGKTQEAADEFLRWDKAGGRVLAGLTKRREAERLMFLGQHEADD